MTPHLVTEWCVTFVFLCNSQFVAPAKVFHMAGCAIDQHHLRTDPYQPVLCKIWWWISSLVVWPRQVPQLGIRFLTSGGDGLGVYALHAQLILVYAICWRARQCFVIFECHIMPVHGFHYRATRPHCYSLDSAKFICRVLFVGQCQHASFRMSPCLSNTTPVANELASTHVFNPSPDTLQLPWTGSSQVTLASTSSTTHLREASLTGSSHPLGHRSHA